MAGSVTIEQREGRALAHLTGKVDHELLERLKGELGGRGAVVLELGGVDYVSSSGLAGIARLSTLHDLKLAALPEGVRDVFDLAGLDKILAIYPGVEEAFAK
jgi:anti-anti-sigma factor